MYLAAGGYLGKLSKLGLVRQQFRGMLHDEDGYALTEVGKRSLKESWKKEETRARG